MNNTNLWFNGIKIDLEAYVREWTNNLKKKGALANEKKS